MSSRKIKNENPKEFTIGGLINIFNSRHM
jgi:hypothetical protein